MTLREAAQQALEALEYHRDKGIGGIYTRVVCENLRAALAEPQRKPLTDEQVRDLWSWSMTPEAERTATTQQHAFARAIERAHGITGGSDE